VLRVDALDRALLLANDLPGVAVTGALAEGEAGLQTDLALTVVDKPLWSGDATLDNAGARSTGVNRLGLNVNGNAPMGLGDLWSASALSNQGSTYLRLGVTAPIGLDGWRLGVNASRMNYRVVDAEFSSQSLEGSSAVLGLDAMYPLRRTPQQNLYFSAALDDKSFINYANGSAVSDYASRAVSWSLYGNRFDEFAGGGSTSGNLTLTQGHLVLDSYPNHAADASNDAIGKQVTKVTEWHGLLHGPREQSEARLDPIHRIGGDCEDGDEHQHHHPKEDEPPEGLVSEEIIEALGEFVADGGHSSLGRVAELTDPGVALRHNCLAPFWKLLV
jgi:hemolysin activation/secretion protein